MILFYIILLLVIHILLAAVSKNQEQHRFGIFCWGRNTSLMVSLVHHMHNENTPYAYTLLMEGFGGYVSFCFGKKFNENEKKVRMFGFNSRYGEIICTEFWWNHIYFTMPWDTNDIFLQELYLNPTGELVSWDEAEPFKTLVDTNYTTKKGEPQHIDKINFFLVERTYTSKLAKFFHMISIFNQKKKSLFWISPSNTTLGESEILAGYIRTYSAIDEAFEKYLTIDQSDEYLNYLKSLVDFRIGCFMMLDKNY